MAVELPAIANAILNSARGMQCLHLYTNARNFAADKGGEELSHAVEQTKNNLVDCPRSDLLFGDPLDEL